MVTLCLVLVDDVGAAGVSVGGCLGSPRGLVGFSVVISFLINPGFFRQCHSTAPGKHWSTGIDEASSAPKRVPPDRGLGEILS